ncbi:MAG TPA: aminotransferase class I/II-fold pyridoxal phosphate-dependent enzyme, partial [Chloroflexi bacterium]|nr:aminotransferase class I/II-fold pyridoxal phosphate-dependent enzyme [Chloroflexota bacterium]
MRVIDLRSDTVTLPTDAMRQAMYRAEVGDDVYGEDPTVNRLEEMAAERLGKEAGLFVVSGTMGNLVSVLTHCGRGDEMILGDEAHIFMYEAGGASALGGVHVRTVPNLPNGMLDPAAVEAAVRDPNNLHYPHTRLVALENTHNRCGGAVLSPAQMATIKAVADRYGLAVHLDGARIFNAAVALGIPAAE